MVGRFIALSLGVSLIVLPVASIGGWALKVGHFDLPCDPASEYQGCVVSSSVFVFVLRTAGILVCLLGPIM